MSRTYYCPESGCKYTRPLTRKEVSEIHFRNHTESGYVSMNCQCPIHKTNMVEWHDLPQVVVEYYDPFGKDFQKTYNQGKVNQNGVKVDKRKVGQPRTFKTSKDVH